MSCLNVVTNTISGCIRTTITILNTDINVNIGNNTTSINCEVTIQDKWNASIESTTQLSGKCTNVIDPLFVQITLFDKLLSNVIVNRNNIVVNYNIVCSPDLGIGYYLFVQEGVFILSDGNKFELIKNEL